MWGALIGLENKVMLKKILMHSGLLFPSDMQKWKSKYKLGHKLKSFRKQLVETKTKDTCGH